MNNRKRGGAGRGPQKSIQKSSPRSNSNASTSASSSNGDERESTSESRGGGSKGHSRKNIKNARSLSDVIGGGAKGRGPRVSAPPPRNPSRGQDDERGESSSPERGTSKGPQSKKLTYIMNFQPPPAIPGSDKSEPVQRRETFRGSPGDSAPAAPRVNSRETGRESTREPAREPSREPARGQSRDQNRNQKPETSRDERGSSKSRPPGVRAQQKPVGRSPRKENPPRETRGRESEDRYQEDDTHKRKDFRWPEARAGAPVRGTAGKKEGGRASSNPGDRHVEGIVKRHPDGYGFLIPSSDSKLPDVYIPRQFMNGIMTNDRVEVQVYSKAGRGKDTSDRLSGEITRVVSRANRKVVGRYLPVDQKYGVILDENHGWGADLRILAQDSMDAKEGDMVAIEVTQYPGHDKEFTGKVVELIGNIDNPINDVIRVIHAQGIPNEFSKKAIAEAQKFGGEVTEEEMRGREDITDLPIVTIDGATAKDFDDAIYVEQDAGGFHLTVAIADVSHYVKPGTPLDQEAYERGTSTYFPNFVVPMLPEELSNELCSLKPNVKRLCFCCEMDINFEGEIQKYRFFEGVMESQARLTYGQAQEIIDAHKAPTPGETKSSLSREVRENVLRAGDLAKILMTKRFREGSLDLELPETQVIVDERGESVDIIKSTRLFAHRLIEELMLITNICTARFLEENQMPGIFRIHEAPKEDNIKALQRYLWNLGGHKASMGQHLQKKLTDALHAIADRPQAHILNILTLRTMQQAKYSGTNVGHFGLNFTQYSHFTSPIRRYPDLIAHRLIKSDLYPRYRSMRMTDEELATATSFLSSCEQRSVKAERQVVSIKKARFIRKFIGEEFEGVISSVTKFGIFVLLRQYDVDGLVKIENLGNDKFIFDDENLVLQGSRTGVKYTIGDPIVVTVVGADPEAGKVDFQLPGVETGVPKRGTPKNNQESRVDVQKRGKGKDNRRGVRKERVSKRRRKD
jgi:ribonuclease R